MLLIPLWLIVYSSVSYRISGFQVYPGMNHGIPTIRHGSTIVVPVVYPSTFYFVKGNPQEATSVSSFHRNDGTRFSYVMPPPSVYYRILPNQGIPNIINYRQDGNSRAPPAKIMEDPPTIAIKSDSAPTCGKLPPFRSIPFIKNIASRQATPVEFLTSTQYEGPDMSKTEFAKYLKALPEINQKITYGQATSQDEAPWQVAMFVKGKFHCGASVISNKFILTAAHCVTTYVSQPASLNLSLGDWDLKSSEDGTPIPAVIEKIIPHPKFSFFTLQNDIALLKVKDEIPFSSRVTPVCLPYDEAANVNVDGELLTVTGWGRNEKNLLQTKLQKLTAVALENSVCADRWSSTGAPRSLISDVTICMDSQTGDSCKGDSGGPAVIEYPMNSGVYMQVGIVSFGSGSCTDDKLPGVYTRVSKFNQWIKDNMI